MENSPLTEDEIAYQRALFEQFRLSDHPSPDLRRNDQGHYDAINTWLAWRYWLKAIETAKQQS